MPLPVQERNVCYGKSLRFGGLVCYSNCHSLTLHVSAFVFHTLLSPLEDRGRDNTAVFVPVLSTILGE